jgi:hypothetical protein
MSARYLDVGAMPPAEVVRRLYNASFSAGLGRLHFKPEDMTDAEAQALLDERMQQIGPLTDETPERRAMAHKMAQYFDYLHGRVMKIFATERPLFVALYDRDNGEGAAARALGVPDVEAGIGGQR